MSTAWIYLFLAGFVEIFFVLFLKLSDGFKNIKYTILFVIAWLLSYYLFGKSLKEIPIGTAYAVWTGIGAAGMVLIGVLFLKESAEFWRLFFACTLIISIVGLKLVSNE